MSHMSETSDIILWSPFVSMNDISRLSQNLQNADLHVRIEITEYGLLKILTLSPPSDWILGTHMCTVKGCLKWSRQSLLVKEPGGVPLSHLKVVPALVWFWLCLAELPHHRDRTDPPPRAQQPDRLEAVEIGQGRGREGAWGRRVVKLFSPVHLQQGICVYMFPSSSLVLSLLFVCCLFVVLRWGWVSLEWTWILSEIQFTTHFIEFLVVETKRFVSSFLNVI